MRFHELVGIFTFRYTDMGVTMNKWTSKGYTKAKVQGRPHLARSSHTTAWSGHSLARLGRTTAGRSLPQPAAARTKPAATGHSRPHLPSARPGSTNRCTHTYHMPRLGSTAPTHPRTSLGWMRNVDYMSFGSKGWGWKHWIDGPTHNHRNRHHGVILDFPQYRRCITW
jgi:hypothetical protein